MTDATAREFANPKGQALDPWSAGVVALMAGGFVALTWAQHHGLVPWWAAVLVGTWLMNLSFTAWHEPSHGTLSRSRSVNHVFGFVASLASCYPGYFARRREHLVHHKWEGVDGKDPVYQRIQTNLWAFPFRLFRLTLVGQKLDVPDSFHPLTRGQRACDALSNALALGVVAASVWFDFWPALAWSWILPRAIVFWLHAYYVCVLPHHLPEGGYCLYRIRDSRVLGPLLQFLTVNQNFHGLHHKWPYIPWHRYRKASRALEQQATDAGIEFIR